MTDYRAIVKHVRYWRGTIHRWSTSYSLTGNGTTPDVTACQTLLAADDDMCYGGSGSQIGGTYEASFYRASGGIPVATYTKFDYSVPLDWVVPRGAGWVSHAALTEPSAETALLVTWPAGYSSTGKPVTFRKWWHMVPVTTAGAGSLPDIPTATITSLVSHAQTLATCLAPTYGLVFGNASRLAGLVPTVDAFYSNHQMPRGRRRSTARLLQNGGIFQPNPIEIGPVE